MNQERPGHTLQPTALVNEAYLKIAGQGGFEWQSRAHFFAVCAQVMRHILVDHARTHARDKRGGGAIHVALEEVLASAKERAPDMVALDDALRTLEALDPQKGRIIELRYFGGLGVDEVAEILKISPATVGREWRRAKAWLFQELQKD
jgi:RNA polymerase sigma factor (TIGR02999 family)